jgi:hypothetical protein
VAKMAYSKYYSRIRKLIAWREIYTEELIAVHQIKESPCPVKPIVENRRHTSMTLELIMSKPNAAHTRLLHEHQ